MPEPWISTLSSVAREPMTEGLLDRVMEGPRLAPPGPTPGHRVTIAVVALAIGLVAVLIAVKSIDTIGTVPASRVTEPQHGWSATVPDGWQATLYPVLMTPREGASPMPTSATGLAFSTFDLGDAHPYDFFPGGSGVLPSDGALVLVDGGPPDVAGRTSPAFPPEPLQTSNPNELQSGFVANGMMFEILGRLGAGAGPDVLAQMNEIVASIQFPPPRVPAVGAAVEIGPGLFSLGPSARYPLRSITPVKVHGGSSMPGQWIVVVHAPDGFYVLLGNWSEQCRLRWDDVDQKIRGCPAHRGPWTKYGGSGLPMAQVDVNFDGQLITRAYPDIHGVPSSYWHRTRP
jgi:hypothetical protein